MGASQSFDWQVSCTSMFHQILDILKIEYRFSCKLLNKKVNVAHIVIKDIRHRSFSEWSVSPLVRVERVQFELR